MGKPVKERVSGILSRYNMCPGGSHVAVAVSGGADSVCLLHVLHELAAEVGLTLSVAHLNHKLRGAASEGDADFVRRLAADLGLDFHYRELDVAGTGGNLEQAGRNARLSFFDDLPANRVATGHTRSDQAETVLYRLLRGSGTAGLAGILPVVGRRVRPLIECTRAEVLEYLRAHALPWREDATNSETSYARNYIRHELLPRVPAAVTEILARTADVARDEEEYWCAEVDRIAATVFQRRPKDLLITVEELLRLPIALQRRVIRRAAQEAKGNLHEIDLFHIDAILQLAYAGEGHGRCQAPGLDVFRSFEWLRIGVPRTESRAERDYSLALQVPGSTRVPGQHSVVRIGVPPNGCTIEEGCTLDADRLNGPLEFRNWRPGDQFTRRGRSSEKIKTLFQLARIPIWDRQGWPVITCGEDIVWARRFGVSYEYLATPESRRILCITEEEPESGESNSRDSASFI
jgi:tRNA(Ile)-lysidine synthase